MKNTFSLFAIIVASLFSTISAQDFVISCEDIGVIYAGIPMEFKAAASGPYKKVTVSPSIVNAVESQIGHYISVSASGVDAKGNTVSLGSRKYLVKKAPKPELTWNGVADGGRGIRSGGALTCMFGNDVPFDPSKGKFEILSYSITIEGVKGSLDGSGSVISPAHLNALRAIEKENSKCTISVKYSGTGTGQVSAVFQL
jgi:hypothetical protein